MTTEQNPTKISEEMKSRLMRATASETEAELLSALFTPAAKDAAATPKRTRRIDWKVDNLRHISDHGALAEFADEAKAAAVAAAFATDGITRIDAGQSHIVIETLGHVSETRAFFSVGSNHVNSIHYRDASAKLSYKFQESTDSDAYSHLKNVIFGESSRYNSRYGPLNSARNSGESSDAFRGWFKSYSWVFFGEQGLRAQAIKRAVFVAEGNTQSAEYHHRKAKNAEEQHTKRNYAQERRAILKEADCQAKRHRARLTKLAELSAEISAAKTASEFPDVSYNVVNGVSKDWYPKATLYFAGINETVSPQVMRPNYTASVDGEKITLSSGLVCPFTYSRLIDFLKGGEPISTNYGPVQRIEASKPDFSPVVLLRCGCHVIDAAGINDELKELLTPSHTVEVKAGTPRLTLTDETLKEFRARCLQDIARQVEAINQQRQQNATDARQRLANHKSEEANHEQTLDRLMGETAKAYEAHEAAKRAEDATRGSFKGATLDQLQELAKTLVSALLPKEL